MQLTYELIPYTVIWMIFVVKNFQKLIFARLIFVKCVQKFSRSYLATYMCVGIEQ